MLDQEVYGFGTSNKNLDFYCFVTFYDLLSVKNVVMSTISKRKQKRSDIEAYYRNENKMF
jgi:hypothetical protein